MKLLSKLLPLPLLFAAGLAHADGPTNADIQKFLAFFDKIVDAVVADKDSCPKMSKDVNAIIDANQDLLERAKKAKADGKQLPDDARKHMMEGAQKMMPAMQKCGSDKDVQAAFKRLDFGGPRAQK